MGMDCALPQGQLQADLAGDWAVISAANNLAQALCHRVKTPVGDLLAHPAYGSQVTLLLGLRSLSVMQLMATGFIRQTLLQDPRVTRVIAVESTASGDALGIHAYLIATVQNTPVDLNLVFPFEH